MAAADDALEKNEFIFDVQGHFVNPDGAWLRQLPEGAQPLRGMPAAGCALADEPGERSYLQCLGPDQFIKDVFLDSDTDMMVLSFVPSTRAREPLTIEEAAATQEIVAKMGGSHRLLVHGRVNPTRRRMRSASCFVTWARTTSCGVRIPSGTARRRTRSRAFRTFQISDEFRERFGYPAITPELKARVFGLNAMKPYGIPVEEMKRRMAADRISSERLAYAERPVPHFRTYGPKTRRDFLQLLANGGG